MGLKSLIFSAALLTALGALGDRAIPVASEIAMSETYVGVGGAIMLPQGGSRLHHVGGAALRAGTYATDYFALEGEAAWLEDVAGLGAQALWFWQGAELYDRFFGYSRFDPFFSFGARGWLGRHAGQLGPKAGIGALYHLTDNWALRADGDFTLGLETKVEGLYSLSVGVQYSF